MSHVSRIQQLVEWLVRWRWPLSAFALVSAALAWIPARGIEFERTVERMFAPDDPLMASYERLKRTFGTNELVLAAYVDPELMAKAPDSYESTGDEAEEEARPPGMERLGNLTKELRAVPGVAHVVSLTNTPLKDGIVNDTAAARALVKVFENFAIGQDRETAGVICLLEPQSETRVTRSDTIARLRWAVERHHPTGVIVGEPVMMVEGFRSLSEDGRFLGWVSTVLLMLTILFSFRSLRWVLAPMLLVGVTLVWTEGTLVLGGFSLSMVSSMLWAVITVVVVATVVHLVIGFREARAAGADPAAALVQAATLLAPPIAWALATDAAGFAALMAARVGPIRDFGFMMALGSGFALVSMATLVPGLALAGNMDTDPRRAWGEGRLDVGLGRLVRWVLRWPWAIGLAALSTIAVAAAGSQWLEVETDFTRNFRSSSPVVASYSLVEARLGGAGAWDVLVPAPAQLDKDYLARIRKLQKRLRNEVELPTAEGGTEPGLTKVVSLVDALDAVTKLPGVGFLGLQGRIKNLDRLMPGVVTSLLGTDPATPDGHYYRIMLRARERQPARQKKQLIADVTRIAREEFPARDGRPAAEVTGFFVLLTNLIDSIVRDQWVAFGLATGMIGLMMAVAFRSPLLAIVGLVPNLLPMFGLLGIMGWLGLRLNMGAAMIAAVSMGLTVDSSIHYLIAFQRLRRLGMTLPEALHASHQTAGRASTLSTLSLMVGFSALCFSQFVPVIYFGGLMVLAIVGSLVGNLVLLPLLLRLVTRD